MIYDELNWVIPSLHGFVADTIRSFFLQEVHLSSTTTPLSVDENENENESTGEGELVKSIRIAGNNPQTIPLVTTKVRIY